MDDQNKPVVPIDPNAPVVPATPAADEPVIPAEPGVVSEETPAGAPVEPAEEEKSEDAPVAPAV